MDRSLGTTAQPRIQDVTPQIQKTHMVYGPSDTTNPAYSSANRSLNYQAGGSINSPELDRVTIIPYTLQYQDTVGLYGKENHFVRVNLSIDRSIALACFEENDWECAMISADPDGTLNTYEPAIIDRFAEEDVDTPIEGYYPANLLIPDLGDLPNAYVSVDLENLKTGNKYIDSWLDVRLYTANKEEHPYDRLFVHLNDYFYIGFHARNTKRLPYNVKCTVGREYVSGLSEENRRYGNRALH